MALRSPLSFTGANPSTASRDPIKTTTIGPQWRSWLHARGITDRMIQRNRLIQRNKYMPQVEEEVPVLAFPYYRDSELVNVKYRDRDKNFRMEPGAERILYGLDDIDPGRVVIVEGELDKLALEAAGIASCVSVPDGAPPPDAKDYGSKFSYLKDLPDAVEEYVLAVDADAPGHRLEEELARRLGIGRCRRVVWPEGVKDANEMLLARGADALRECIEHAQSYPVAGVFGIPAIHDKVVNLYHHGIEPGRLAGLGEFDSLYSIRPGELTVITGIPGSGKSELTEYLLVRLAAMHGWRFALFSPEHQPIEVHASRLVEKFTRQPFSGPNRMDDRTMEDGLEEVHRHFFWIAPPNVDDWTLDEVLDKARILVVREGIRGLLIDPWNELESLRPRDVTETEYVGQCLKRMRQFALSNGVHVWVVVHPAK